MMIAPLEIRQLAKTRQTISHHLMRMTPRTGIIPQAHQVGYRNQSHKAIEVQWECFHVLMVETLRHSQLPLCIMEVSLTAFVHGRVTLPSGFSLEIFLSLLQTSTLPFSVQTRPS